MPRTSSSIVKRLLSTRVLLLLSLLLCLLSAVPLAEAGKQYHIPVDAGGPDYVLVTGDLVRVLHPDTELFLTPIAGLIPNNPNVTVMSLAPIGFGRNSYMVVQANDPARVQTIRLRSSLGQYVSLSCCVPLPRSMYVDRAGGEVEGSPGPAPMAGIMVMANASSGTEGEGMWTAAVDSESRQLLSVQPEGHECLRGLPEHRHEGSSGKEEAHRPVMLRAELPPDPLSDAAASVFSKRYCYLELRTYRDEHPLLLCIPEEVPLDCSKAIFLMERLGRGGLASVSAEQIMGRDQATEMPSPAQLKELLNPEANGIPVSSSDLLQVDYLRRLSGIPVKATTTPTEAPAPTPTSSVAAVSASMAPGRTTPALLRQLATPYLETGHQPVKQEVSFVQTAQELGYSEMEQRTSLPHALGEQTLINDSPEKQSMIFTPALGMIEGRLFAWAVPFAVEPGLITTQNLLNQTTTSIGFATGFEFSGSETTSVNLDMRPQLPVIVPAWRTLTARAVIDVTILQTPFMAEISRTPPLDGQGNPLPSIHTYRAGGIFRALTSFSVKYRVFDPYNKTQATSP